MAARYVRIGPPNGAYRFAAALYLVVRRFDGPASGRERQSQQPGGQSPPVLSAVRDVPDVRPEDRDSADGRREVLERVRTSRGAGGGVARRRTTTSAPLPPRGSDDER